VEDEADESSEEESEVFDDEHELDENDIIMDQVF